MCDIIDNKSMQSCVQMKKACSYCGKIHDRNFRCSKIPKYSRGNAEDSFRWSYEWKCKRDYIKKRDRYLCRACYCGLSGTLKRLNNENLSVHHIVPLKADFSKRLDDNNLITLCTVHHEMAEKGEISAETLIRAIPPVSEM